MRVSAKTGEQLRTRFQRLQQMECFDGAARAMCFAFLAREDERRPPISLHDTSSTNANHTAMPTFAFQHQRVRFSHLGRCFNLR